MNLFNKNIKNIFIFEEKKEKKPFELSSDNEPNLGLKKQEESDDKKEEKSDKEDNSKENKKNENLTPKKLFDKVNFDKVNKEEKDEAKKPEIGSKSEDILKREYVSKKLDENLRYIKAKYTIPTNGDIVIREFDIVVNKKVVSAFIVFIDGMVDRSIVNLAILQPLMVLSNIDIKDDGNSVSDYVKNHLVPHNQLKISQKYSEIIGEVNFGGCGIFVDGIDEAYAADVKGWEHRTIGRPNTELVIRGPQEGFNEILRMNTALIRKILKDEELIAENIIVGDRSKTPCALLYIKDIANNSLVNEVRRRLESIKIDYIIDSGELEQLLEDSTFLPTPQILATERPDRVASALAEGKVAVAMHGSPFSLIMPTTFFSLLHSPEDSYIRYPYATFFRLIRVFGIIMSLLLPGLYVAITNFHHEMIPTDLIIAIEASREKVPFPSVLEILIMELSFELIREAGIRIPGPIGPTLGIIGALILGQAAVAANIVSPILIIIVAVTGIGSFAVPNFSLGYAFRALRFVYIIIGALVGFFGISLGVFIHLLLMVHAKSFGVPFLSPLAPVTAEKFTDTITRAPVWKQERRPDFLNPKDKYRQPKITRQWTDETGGENNSDKE